MYVRDIKFRLWDKKYKRMIYQDGCCTFTINGDGMVTIDALNYAQITGEGYGWTRFTDNKKEVFEIMQFTGLQDSEGKDIYEGDIVEYQASYDISFKSGIETITEKCIVEYKKYGFTPFINEREGSYTLSEFKVIGNKYENPDIICQ